MENNKPTESDGQFALLTNGVVEHYDAGIIAVTWEEEGQTRLSMRTFGNNFALRGLAEEVLSNVMPEQVSEDDDEEEAIH